MYLQVLIYPEKFGLNYLFDVTQKGWNIMINSIMSLAHYKTGRCMETQQWEEVETKCQIVIGLVVRAQVYCQPALISTRHMRTLRNSPWRPRRLHQRTLLPSNITVIWLVNYTNHLQPRWNPSTVLNRKSNQRKILCLPTVLLPLCCLSFPILSFVLSLPCELTRADALLNNSRHLVRQLRQSRRTLRACRRRQRKRKRANAVVTARVSDSAVPAYPHYHWTHFSWTCLGFFSLVSSFTPYFMFIYLSQPLIFMSLCHYVFLYPLWLNWYPSFVVQLWLWQWKESWWHINGKRWTHYSSLTITISFKQPDVWCFSESDQ